MLSAMFIMDSKGSVIISRNYRGDVPMTVNERFATTSRRRRSSSDRPVFTDEGYTFVYIKRAPPPPRARGARARVDERWRGAARSSRARS